MAKGKLLIISGYPGSGKDTAVEEILADQNLGFKRIITHNTRAIRQGEKHGREYFFVSEKEFKALIKSGQMVEYVYHGYCFKGTTTDQFQRILTGENLIWRINPERAAFAEEFFLEKFGKEQGSHIIESIIKIFIAVDNPTLLLERYKGREKDTYSIAEFEKRLKQDMEIFENNKNRFPHIIKNDKTAEKFKKKVLAIIRKNLVR